MSFDWQGYLEVAAYLSRSGEADGFRAGWATPPVEALHRAAASRAYYSAFNKTVQRLEEKSGYAPKQFRGPQCHEAVRNAFRNKHGASKQIFDLLETTLRLRKHADYDEQRGFSENDAMKAIANARRIIELLSRV